MKNHDLENHAEKIFNMDETGLGMDPTNGKVFVPKMQSIQDQEVLLDSSACFLWQVHLVIANPLCNF